MFEDPSPPLLRPDTRTPAVDIDILSRSGRVPYPTQTSIEIERKAAVRWSGRNITHLVRGY